MARKLRMEYAGAVYHVINRGNYRKWVFEEEGAKAAFEACMFESCAKSGWVLHAYVVMGNHYHLLVETPQGNLVAGMQWLQSTFANRFNRLRGERGHLFQGRYHALLVEPGEALAQVSHYLHLNPVRAGVVRAAQLGDYRYSSYWYLWRPKQRPACLCFTDALHQVGGLPDRKAGWQRYAAYLAWAAEESPVGRNAAYVSLSRGWAVGGPEFRQGLLQEHDLAKETRVWKSDGARAVRREHWASILGQLLALIPAEAQTDARKSAPWKVAVATRMKALTQVPNGWLAERLVMGSPIYVSKHVGLLRRNGGAAGRWLERLEKVNSKA